MRIAVTGGSGFIGGSIVQKLLEKGHQVTILDLKQPLGSGAGEFRKTDVGNLDEVMVALKDMDCVYHVAGALAETMRKTPYQDCQLQLNGTLNVLEASRLLQVQKVLLASSYYVYGGLEPNLVVDEKTRLSLGEMEVFGASKLMAEVLAREYSRRYGLDCIILRYGSAYGYAERSNVIKAILEAGLEGKTHEIWGEGKRRTQYTYIDDIAAGSVLALEGSSQTYNLISPQTITARELADLLQQKYGFNFVFAPAHPEGPTMAYISPQKAMQELGWQPIPLELGIEKTMAELLKRRRA